MVQQTIDILGLNQDKPKASDFYPAVDTTDTTQSLEGSTNKYLLADLYNFILNGLGFITLPSANAASTANYNATYNNGAGGVNATLTDATGTFAAFTIDGIPGVVGDFYLIKNQLNPAQNGIYVLSINGDGNSIPWVLVRAYYFNSPTNILNGAILMVTGGLTNANSTWQVSFTGPLVVGTTAINFTAITQTALFPLPPFFGGTGVSSPTAHTLPVAEGSAPFHFLGPLTNGQLLIGSIGADPVPSTITAGTGITIINAPGSITIGASGSGLNWSVVTSSTQAIVSGSGYIPNNGGGVTFTLPASANVGDVFAIIGMTGQWTIAQNAGQSIQVGTSTSTIGVGGSVSSTNASDAVEFVCIVANTKWSVTGGPQSAGLTIV